MKVAFIHLCVCEHELACMRTRATPGGVPLLTCRSSFSPSFAVFVSPQHPQTELHDEICPADRRASLLQPQEAGAVAARLNAPTTGTVLQPASHTSTRAAHPPPPDDILPPAPSVPGFRSSLRFPLPILSRHGGHPISFTPANQGLPNHAGRWERNSEERSEAAILCFIRGRSGFLLIS